MNSHSMRGVAMVLMAAALWGTTGTAQSFAPVQLSSYWIGTLRLLAAALFFLPWLALTERKALSRNALAALPWPRIVAAAICMSVYNLAFFAGVRASGVAVGTAIALGSGPVWAGVLQALARGRAPSLAWWAGTGVAVAGVALMMSGPGAGTALFSGGVLLCLLAGLAYAVYALVNKQMMNTAAAGPVTAAVFVLAAILALPMALALAGLPTVTSSDLVVVAWLGVMSTGVAYLLFSHALRHISSATGVALALGEPVVAFVLAITVIGERPGVLAFVGLLAVLAGLAGVIRAELSGARLATE